MPLLIAFIAVPMIEIALFIQVGGAIGIWATLLIVLVTALAGSALVRSQGLREIGRLQNAFSQLEDPTEPLANGAMILFAGALLLTPGFFTDALGLALLLPGVRRRVFLALRARISTAQFEMGRGVAGSGAQRQGDHVIDGQFEEIIKPNDPPAGPSGWTRH